MELVTENILNIDDLEGNHLETLLSLAEKVGNALLTENRELNQHNIIELDL